MSPLRGRPASSSIRFPRVSGDEPWNRVRTPEAGEFSPRERG